MLGVWELEPRAVSERAGEGVKVVEGEGVRVGVKEARVDPVKGFDCVADTLIVTAEVKETCVRVGVPVAPAVEEVDRVS